MAQPQLIKSLDKGLRILEIIGDQESPVSISQLSRMLDMNRSSVFRLLATLKARGYVMNANNSKAFVLGSTILALSNGESWVNTLVQVSRKHLATLAILTGETAHIGMLAGDKTIIVDNEMSPQTIGVTVKRGDTGLIHCTSVGKAMVLHHTKEDLLAIFPTQFLELRTQKTLKDINTLIDELALYQPLGYVIDDEEYNEGVRCIGVPIQNASGKIIAALSISAPVNRLPKQCFAETANIIKQVANEISKELGIQPSEKIEELE